MNDFAVSETSAGSNRRAERFRVFAASTRAQLIEEARVDRRRTRRRQRNRLSEIAGTQVERPEISETMPFREGSACELASTDYVFYPDDNGFLLAPPKTAEVSDSEHLQLYVKACECGWRTAPSSMCFNLTELELKGQTRIYLPGFEPYLMAYK